MKQLVACILPLKGESLNYFYGFLLFLLLMPSFLWNIGNADLYVFILIVILNIYMSKKLSIGEVLSIFGFAIFYIYATQYKNINATVISLLLLTFIIVKENFMLSSFGYFKKFFAFSLGLSMIFFLLHLCLINLPYEQIEPLNKAKMDTYYQYPFFVITNSISNNILPRFFGMFDEPGVVGTFTGIILFIEKYKFSKQNLIFLAAGIMSFSFYFILLTVIGVLIFMNGSKKFVWILVFVSIFLFTKGNPKIDTLIWKRIQIEDGRLAGDNRSSDALNTYYLSFINSFDFLWGRLSVGNVNISSASYKQLIINYGLIMCLFYMFCFCLLSYSKIGNWKYTMLSIILISTLLYQRPFIFLPIYFFACYIPMIVFKLERN